MTGVGPFPLHAVVVVVAALLAWAVARGLARRQPGAPHRQAGALVGDAVLIGLLVARLAYVLLWWREYAAAPWSILRIGDGGFVAWAGIGAGFAFAAWRARTDPRLRRAVLAGMAAGVLAWLATGAAWWWMQRSAPALPDLQLSALDGRPVALQDYRGEPVVLNLWATWCPPCRREMPVLAHAQRAYPGVHFILVNQGEDPATIASFLSGQDLRLENVLRDPHSQAMVATGTRGLPTTLYYDAQGRLVDSHMGELSRASLADALQRRFDIAPSAGE